MGCGVGEVGLLSSIPDVELKAGNATATLRVASMLYEDGTGVELQGWHG